MGFLRLRGPRGPFGGELERPWFWLVGVSSLAGLRPVPSLARALWTPLA
jgi:hypothetical protein